MRTILFFDLPTLTKQDNKNYRKFMKLLKINGFYMIQESVYVKMSIDMQTENSTLNRIRNEVPNNGNIMALTVTEKQFAGMEILLGHSKTDVITTDDRIITL